MNRPFARIVEIRRRREQSLQRVLANMREARDACACALRDAQQRVCDQEKVLADYWASLVDGLGAGLDYHAFQAALPWRDALQARLDAERRTVPQFEAALCKAEAGVVRATDNLNAATRALRKIDEQRRRECEADRLAADLLADIEADEFIETWTPKGARIGA